MLFERKLRKLQDQLRNAGWRIQHIPWQPEGKLEVYNPGDPFTWLLIVAGCAAFFGGVPLLSRSIVSTPSGIGIMIGGILLLLLSRFTTGYTLYRKYIRVDATCIDREIREYEDPESSGSLIKNTFWTPRLLCQYNHNGQTFTVTPIIVKMIAFGSEEAVNNFLADRIDDDRHCTLWINPDAPLQTFFHKKPMTGPHTN